MLCFNVGKFSLVFIIEQTIPNKAGAFYVSHRAQEEA